MRCMRELTLRHVEAVRAVMVTGTIAGAAALLHVSAPGISRLVKYTEQSLGLRLFERKAGRFVPSAEAERIFEQTQQIHEKVGNPDHAVRSLRRGREVELAFAAAPSLAQSIVGKRGNACTSSMHRAGRHRIKWRRPQRRDSS